MTKEQFISLLKTPSTINLNMVKGLEEITERFPYFQNAHLLLAKQYQGHQNIRYESYLRKAAAYASDRRVLYDLIKLEPEEIIHIEPGVEPMAEGQGKVNGVEPIAEGQGKVRDGQEKVIGVETMANVEPVAEGQGKVRDSQEKVIGVETMAKVQDNIIDKDRDEEIISSVMKDDVLEEEIFEAVDDVEIIEESDEDIRLILDEEEENEDIVRDVEPISIEPIAEGQGKVRDGQEKVKGIEQETKSQEKVREKLVEAADPKEILEKRLRELGQTKEEPVVPEAKVPVEKKSLDFTTVVPPIPSTEEIVPEASAEPEFVRIRRELREPRESRETREPRIKAEEPKKENEQHTFLDWLKLKDNVPIIPTEKPTEYFHKGDMPEDANKPGDNLIDQFIKTEPRIVPARSEFYSPGNMARQSAVDHEDLISETLARIYAQQGNIPKAIDAYKRLSLKIPEKSSYFAALIKELEQKDQS